MLVFLLGITPKKVLHNWIANHSDQVPVGGKNHHTQISYAGYQCNVENLVSESPFENVTFTTPAFDKPSFFVPYSASIVSYYSQHFYTRDLRGPPIVKYS